MFRMVGLSYPSWKGIFVVVKVILKTLTDLPAFYCTSKQWSIHVPVTGGQILYKLSELTFPITS